jgi:hypothetical protein
MGVARRGQVKRALQEELPGGAWQEVGAANNIGYRLLRVVDHDGELVGHNLIAPSNDDISKLAHIEATRSLEAICKAYAFGLTHTKAHSSRPGAGRLIATRTCAPAMFTIRAAAPRAVAVKSEAAVSEVAQGVLVERKAATLIFDGPIPGEAECLQGALDFIGAARAHARGVEVFDAQKPTAAMPACVEKAAKRSDQ